MRPRYAALAAVLALGFPAQSNASVPGIDSPAASSDSVATSKELNVGLERDLTVSAVRVEPSSDFVRVIHADGTEEYISNHRIRWIHDAEGRDKTSLVLDRGKSLGEIPVTVRYAAARASRTLRGRPLPVKKTFPVIQVGVLARLDQENMTPSRRFATGEHPASVMVDLGAMKNVSQHWAVGADFCFAGDEDYSRFGPKVRFRRWLGSDVAIDVAPGILLSATRPDASEYLPGLVGELGISFGDWMSLTGQVETATRKQYYNHALPSSYGYGYDYLPREATRTEVSWYLGGKFGGEAALIGFFGALLVGMIVSTGSTPTMF